MYAIHKRLLQTEHEVELADDEDFCQICVQVALDGVDSVDRQLLTATASSPPVLRLSRAWLEDCARTHDSAHVWSSPWEHMGLVAKVKKQPTTSVTSVLGSIVFVVTYLGRSSF